MKRLLGWFGWLALAAILGIVAFVLVAVRQGWEFDAVLSGSMEPGISVGGLVVIRPVDGQDVKVGDVVSFKYPGMKTPICHRVIELSEENGNRQFITKGDANDAADIEPVLAEYVTGREVAYLPYVGRLADLSRLGRERVYFLGRGFPRATIVVAAMGLLFIGITLKDTIEDLFQPEKRLRKDALKKQKERQLRRGKAFGRR